MKTYFCLIFFIIFLAGCQNKDTSKSQNFLQEQNAKPTDERDIKGIWTGTIKDGTNWVVEIWEFDGRNFKGSNTIFWEKYPEGYKTPFSGTLSNNKIEIFEDAKVRNSGKFIGTISGDFNSIKGIWYRYSDNGSYLWDLERNKE